jgi:hypothetical protein
MISYQTPLTKDIIERVGYIYLPSQDIYYRESSAVTLKYYPAVANQAEIWQAQKHIAGQEPTPLCEVQGLSHLIMLCLVLEGDDFPITIKTT